MSRIQLALDVDDLDTSIAFYTRLLGIGPAKVKPGYANFAVAEPPLKLVLLENPGRGGGVNHLGIEVGSSAEVAAETERLRETGLLTAEETASTCCWATQDKAWATGPDGERWEVYTVLADAEVFGTDAFAAAPGAGSAAGAESSGAAEAAPALTATNGRPAPACC